MKTTLTIKFLSKLEPQIIAIDLPVIPLPNETVTIVKATCRVVSRSFDINMDGDMTCELVIREVKEFY